MKKQRQQTGTGISKPKNSVEGGPLSEDGQGNEKIKKLRIASKRLETIITNVVPTLQTELQKLSEENIEILNETTIKFTELRSILSNLPSEKKLIFNLENFELKNQTLDFTIDLFFKILDTIKQTVQTINLNRGQQVTIDRFKDILKTKDSIEQYVIDTFFSKDFFGPMAGYLTVKPQIKPQIIVYLQRYGKPPEGRFDQKLLAEIEKELNL